MEEVASAPPVEVVPACWSAPALLAGPRCRGWPGLGVAATEALHSAKLRLRPSNLMAGRRLGRKCNTQVLILGN